MSEALSIYVKYPISEARNRLKAARAAIAVAEKPEHTQKDRQEAINAINHVLKCHFYKNIAHCLFRARELALVGAFMEAQNVLTTAIEYYIGYYNDDNFENEP